MKGGKNNEEAGGSAIERGGFKKSWRLSASPPGEKRRGGKKRDLLGSTDKKKVKTHKKNRGKPGQYVECVCLGWGGGVLLGGKKRKNN